MISSPDEVKILDFGLAKLGEEQAATASALEEQDTATELTREGKLLGTPSYMSPEQARGQEVDARTDVFAFGVVLYEMMTGERPFVGETTPDVLTAVTRDTPKRHWEPTPRSSGPTLTPHPRSPRTKRATPWLRCRGSLRSARPSSGIRSRTRTPDAPTSSRGGRRRRSVRAHREVDGHF
jgi:serine/threonine protein kinase